MTFNAKQIQWDTEVDGEMFDVDLPAEADVVLNDDDVKSMTEEEQHDYVIDVLTEKFGFLISGCVISRCSD